MAEEKDLGRALEWDDEIEKDDNFSILPPGDYNFEVQSFERGSFPGSAKLPACNKAVLNLRVFDGNGNETIIKTDFILHSMLEWKISEIHRAVGLKKHGEKLRMKWKEMVGLKGLCKVSIRNFTKRDGSTGEANQVDKFYDPDTVSVQVPAPKPKQGSMFAPRGK